MLGNSKFFARLPLKFYNETLNATQFNWHVTTLLKSYANKPAGKYIKNMCRKRSL